VAGCAQSDATTTKPCKTLPSASRRALGATVKAGSPGALGVVDVDGRRTCGAAGYSNLRTRTAMRVSDRWIIASATKPFVAAVILQLVQEGKLALTTTVSDVLPGLVPRGDEITVENLLRHTSGLADYYSSDGFQKLVDMRGVRLVLTPLELARLGAQQPLGFTPGRSYEYSNTNWIVLGLIVEKVTGNTLERELTTRIFEPLRLTDTRFDAYRTPRGRIVHGYELGGNGWLEDPGSGYADTKGLGPTILLGWADGAIVSSARDLVTFYRAFLTGRLLDAATQRRFLTFDRNDSALGLYRQDYSCGTVYCHNGSTSGYGTNVFASRDGSVVAVSMDNASDDDAVDEVADTLGEKLYCAARPAR
jgi:D-alanyl-D-alanine carboxypeptidase